MLRNVKLASALLGVLVIFCVMQLVTQALGFWSLSTTRDDVGALSDVAITQVDAVAETTQHLMDARINLSRAGTRMVRGGTAPTDIIAHARDELTKADTSFARFTSAAQTSEEARARAQALTENYKVYRGALAELAEFLTGGNIQAFLDQPTQKYQDAFLAKQRDFMAYGDQVGTDSLKAIDHQFQAFEGVAITIMVVLVGGVIAMHFAARALIVRPLEEVGVHFDQIKQGNLSESIEERGNNEIGRLFAGLRAMQLSVASTVRTVRTSAESIHLGADEIATGNADLSARTEQQAASLEQTAASMEELTATVKQNADHAQEAHRLVEDGLLATQRGGEVVGQVVDRMQAIADSSKKIRDIIAVIDGIAFQTNILALNAAVEAARAGEQGRGFAVVAGEVRNLAQRSAQSAKEIAALISASVSEINGGTEMVERAGSAMSEVSTAISRVAERMSEISNASIEQRTGIEQVNVAVTQMDSMTQQNAALVEEAAAAAASLHTQTRQMKDAVAGFRLAAH
ncbi:Methyl-accepting chemotaxis aspartate transducer [Pararobbsia alpina]|uniref:methyl-accepting chemotaxis protein n=1 Tax=Pararobbsia alpina TaxID=621374 RepID=UPI0039A70ADB